MLRPVLQRMFESAMRHNRDNILGLARQVRRDEGCVLLDLGCDEGTFTAELAHAAGATEVHGVEIVPERAAEARARGIQVHLQNLNAPLSPPSAAFDVVHANRVIEHVADVNLFVSELHRLLREGGRAIVSTENGSSWHNVAASVMGWQIFSLTNVSAKVGGIGNPAALHRGAVHFAASWTHKTIFNYRGLVELFEVHGFGDVEVRGAGYYPLPSVVGAWDVRHSHFITISATR